LLTIRAVTLSALVGALGCRETVETAPGFTEAKFLSVRLGSSREQVVAVLGEPLERWNHWNTAGVWDQEYWSYRQRTEVGVTHHAVLIFAARGPLQGRELEWYED